MKIENVESKDKGDKENKDALQYFLDSLLFSKEGQLKEASDYSEYTLQRLVFHLPTILSEFKEDLDDQLSHMILVWLQGMEVATTVQIVIALSETISSSDGPIFTLFRDACRMATVVDASCDVHIVGLVEAFIALGDSHLLHALVEDIVAYTESSKHVNLVANLLVEDLIWSSIVAVDRFILPRLARELDTRSLYSIMGGQILDLCNYQEDIDGATGSKDSVVRSVVMEISWMLVERDFYQAETEDFLEVFLGIYLLFDEALFLRLVHSLVERPLPDKQQQLLMKVLHEETIVKICARESLGRGALQTLGQKYVELVAGSETAPKFTWSQPNAQIQKHPLVEAFLRGTEESFMYHAFCNLGDARKFVLEEHFGGVYQNGYCAIGEALGRGGGACCVILKSPVAFVHSWREIKERAEGREAGKRSRAKGARWTERTGAEFKRPKVERFEC